MTLPKLPPARMRQEDEPDYQKEIWKPSWNCYCCEDTGMVTAVLARMVISDYQYGRDRIPICQCPGCNKGNQHLHLEGCFDLRLTATICQELDRISRQSWAETTQQKFTKVKELAQKMSLRKTDRTENDNREIRQRKAEIESITHEEWIAEGKKYFAEVEF